MLTTRTGVMGITLYMESTSKQYNTHSEVLHKTNLRNYIEWSKVNRCYQFHQNSLKLAFC